VIILDFPNAITNIERFFDRQDEQARAIDTLLSGKHVPVVIFGERRIGKTSLQNIVIERIKRQNPSVLPLIIEPRDINTVDNFAAAIFRRLTTLQKKDLRDTGLVDDSGNIHIEDAADFEKAFFRLIQDNAQQTYLLCVDEFDEIIRLTFKTSPREGQKLLYLLLHWIERSPLPLTLFFTMMRIPEPLKDEFASPLVTKADVIELFPFSAEKTHQIITWLMEEEVQISAETIDWLVSLSGGHPYFIKLLLSCLLQEFQDQTPEIISQPGQQKRILERALADSRAKYAIKNIYKAHLSSHEKSVLLYLSERNEWVPAFELVRAGKEYIRAAYELVKRNYVMETEGNFMFRIQFLSHWFRNWEEFEEELDRLDVLNMARIGIDNAGQVPPGS
jgi:hypothetical protein